MTLTEIAIKRPSLIIVLFTILMGGGYFCYTLLNYELMPEFSQPTLIITTPYPGAAPSEVEQSVTKEVEDVLSSLDGLKSTTSQSYEGVSVIIAEFDPSVEIDDKQTEAQRSINNIMSTLPDDVKTPSISKVSPSDAPILQFMAVSKMSDGDSYDVLKNEIVPQFQQIQGVGEIKIIGGQEREIKVNVDKDKLNFYKMSLLEVTQAIGQGNIDFPTGKVKSDNEQITVRLAGKFKNTEEIKELVIRTPENGNPIRIGDVADVYEGLKEITSLVRYNKQNGIGIIVKKQRDANAVKISEKAHEIIKKIETQYKDKGVKIFTTDDSSVFTLESVDAVTHDLTIAVVLVAVVMLLFLHSLRDSLIVLVAIPASLLSTFLALYIFGYSLNLMTLLAMSLVIGILVDDSIVVLENIHRHLHMGKDKVQATLDGRSEIGFSALAITFVDVVVFAPIAMINTVIGDVLRQYAVTIVVATLMSLLVCFTLTPWLASRFGKVTHLREDNPFHLPLIYFEKFIKSVTNLYLKLLNWVLRHKIVFSLFVVSLFVMLGFVMQMGIMGTEMFANGDRGKFRLKLEYDKSTALHKNNLNTLEIENIFMRSPEVQNVFANVAGQSTSGGADAISVGAENKSELIIEMVPVEERNISTEDFMLKKRTEILKKHPGIKINSNVIGIAAQNEPIELSLIGENKELLYKTAQQLKAKINAMDGSNDVSVSVEAGSPEVNVRIDRERMAQLGLNIQTVGATLQNAFTGNTDSKYRIGTNEYDINVRYDEFDRKNPTNLADIGFTNRKGELIKLSQFATFDQGTGASMLERRDRRSSVTIRANILGITSGKLGDQIDELFVKEPLPKGIEKQWFGDRKNQGESFGALGTALLIGIALVYLIMVALYDSFIYPFVVMFSVPVALIGAFLALNLAKASMSIFTMLGIIMLIGLVTKNGILLVDFTNHRKSEGEDTLHALMDAGKERLRPILMTTIAMVIGMLPIALAKGAGAEWKNGLAIVMIGGLLSSLALTVFVVPMVYMIVDTIENFILRRKVEHQTKKERKERQRLAKELEG